MKPRLSDYGFKLDIVDWVRNSGYHQLIRPMRRPGSEH